MDLRPVEWADANQVAGAIQRLSPSEFASLCNEVLAETAEIVRAAPSCIRTNLEIFDPDEGLDAACIDAGIVAAPWIPNSERVGYQYKSGRTRKTARQVVEEDILGKAGVVALLEAGGAFVYMTAWDRGEGFAAEMLELARENGLDLAASQLQYVGGDMLARQLLSLPALLTTRAGIELGGLASLEEWERFTDLRNPFESDEVVALSIADLRTRLASDGSRIRVVGRRGDGNTRLVLEAIRGTRLERTVLYARHPKVIPQRFLTYLRRKASVRCTLVVDQADAESMRELEQELSISNSSDVRLVVIGPSELRRHPGLSEVLEVSPLDGRLLQEIVRADAPGLPIDRAREIARICSGSPKFALFLSRRVRENPELTTQAQLIGDHAVQDTLDTYLSIDLTDPIWRAAAAVALVDNLGWTGSLSEESERVFEAVGLDPTAARHSVDELDIRSGIIPLAGRLRHVSPPILGNHLAAKQIRAWSPEQFRRFLTFLTPRMMERFAIRLRQLGRAVEENRLVVERHVLGEHGPFGSIQDLEEAAVSSLLRHLAAPFRHSTVQLISRLIGSASKEELRSATRSRRDLVNALEELLWFEDTFEEAATLILSLASAENEGWANNASEIWREIFQQYLGRTAAGSAARARVLQSAAQSDDIDRRRLAAEAIQSSFRMENISRFGSPPADIPEMPKEAWHPRTYGEWGDVILSHLEILDALLSDSDPTVQTAALEALGSAARAALLLPGVIDSWSDLVQRFVSSAFGQRRILRRAIALEVRFVRRELEESHSEVAEEARGTLETRLDRLDALALGLTGTDFQSRFRNAIAARSYEEAEDLSAAEGALLGTLGSLVEEAIEDPELLEAEWDWLVEELNERTVGGSSYWGSPIARGILQMRSRSIRFPGVTPEVGCRFMSLDTLKDVRTTHK